MIPLLTTLWASKWFRYALALAGLAVLLLGLRAHYIHQGKIQGNQEAKAEVTQDNETQRAAERTSAVSQIQAANETAARAQAAFTAAVEREAQLAKAVDQLTGQRKAGQDHVGQMAPSEFHGYVVHQLAVRPPADPTPGYTPEEERKLAQIVTDYPLLVESNAKNEQRLGELGNQVTELGHKQEAADRKFSALVGYTQELEHNYVQLYNAFPRKRPWYLRILGVKPKKIPYPDPAALEGQRPK